jgi:aspartate aminotransferase
MLADRMKTLAPSSTLAVQAKAKALRARGVDVISFGAGEPDFDTPARIKDAAVQAMRQGHTKYTEVGGIPELRAAVCTKFKRDNGLDYDPAEILVSVGAKHTLFNLAVALLNPGDEVLVPSPYWVSYPEQIRLVGAVPVAVATDEATGFDLDPGRLRAAVTPRTRRSSSSTAPTTRRGPSSRGRRWRRRPAWPWSGSCGWSPTSATSP